MKTFLNMLAAGLLCSAMLADAATVEVQVADPTPLQTMQRKASEYERYRAQYEEIQGLLDNMLELLAVETGAETPHKASAGIGKLALLLEKAKQADVLAREIEQVRAELQQTLQERDSLKQELTTALAERDTAAEKVKGLVAEADEWKKKISGLHDTINRLLLGEFEYYEVKEGDTLQSIAANPMVYGDPSKAAWLRQVNDGRVKHLENLMIGEVLIIPFFPSNGAYEF
jgi:hypothetical protein